jgi:hypothetical protein
MAADRATGILDRNAVVYAQGHAVRANFIWREFSGRDIGVDAVLEQPSPDKKRDELRGLILLQTKATADRGKVDVTGLKARHFNYWLTQQLPVVVCRVFTAQKVAPGFRTVKFNDLARIVLPQVTQGGSLSVRISDRHHPARFQPHVAGRGVLI